MTHTARYSKAKNCAPHFKLAEEQLVPRTSRLGPGRNGSCTNQDAQESLA